MAALNKKITNKNNSSSTTKTKKVIQDVKTDKIKKVLVRKTTTKIISPAKKILQALHSKKTKTKIVKKKITKKPEKKKVVKKESQVKKEAPAVLKKVVNNPIISPTIYSWESEATLNPAAVCSSDDTVHLFYRALGPDGVSRIGYASSKDGINFDTRLTYPVYSPKEFELNKNHFPYTSPARFNPSLYTSGGGWGGCEDPRVVLIDGRIYMTLNIFNGWSSLRVAVVSITEKNLINKKWIWEDFAYLSKPGDRQKNWVLFPEKINGKFVLFLNLDIGDPNRVSVTYLNKLDDSETPAVGEALDPQRIPDHNVAWHYRTRSAACPPIKTKDGWLLLYHAMDRNDPNKYKVGALILDLKNPEKVLFRSSHPILEPSEWYENDYKPGIVYVNGAVVKNGKLIVYYGGGDKHVCIASIKLSELINSLKQDKIIKLKNIKEIKDK